MPSRLQEVICIDDSDDDHPSESQCDESEIISKYDEVKQSLDGCKSKVTWDGSACITHYIFAGDIAKVGKKRRQVDLQENPLDGSLCLDNPNGQGTFQELYLRAGELIIEHYEHDGKEMTFKCIGRGELVSSGQEATDDKDDGAPSSKQPRLRLDMAATCRFISAALSGQYEGMVLREQAAAAAAEVKRVELVDDSASSEG